MRTFLRSKLLQVLAGVLLVAAVAVPIAVNVIHSRAVKASNQAQSNAGNTAYPDLLPGFAKTLLAKGLHDPTVFVFAPNGDIYLGEQQGAILIYRGGVVLPTPLIQLSTDGSNERGLLGLALDPNFATNGYMYVSYTTLDDHAQLSRFTVVNSVASPASEVVYMKGNQLQNPHHSANDLHVGPDGKLWWAVADNVPVETNGRTLSNIYGKMLRFRLDGSIPTDNPFIHVPGAIPYIYAYGLRNPFRFTFLPNGKAMTEDTGSSYWEELNTIQLGGNYGWNFYEGNCGSCGYINPTYAYGHLPTDGAASAISAYSGKVFPSVYNHVVFFGDYNRQDIEAVQFDPTFTTEISDTVFDNSVGTIADLQEGPDGNLYYVSIFNGTFSEITAPGPFPPVAAAMASPSAGLSPLTVQFSSAGSNDPYGLPLTYSWNFGDGSPVDTTANPMHIYTTNASYIATLTVSNGTLTGTATTTVVVGNTPPSASIITPVINSTYNGGDTISFSGTATDAVDGTLPASAYTWQADFYANGVVQPFYNSEVPNPYYGPVSGITSGTFQIPQDLSNVSSSFYRITLTVVDSLGLKTVVTRDIQPHLTNWTVNTNIPGTGAGYFVDGTWHTSAYSPQDVVGVQHVLVGGPPQQLGGVLYRFNGWADGSALADSFTNSASNGTYTANYDQVSTTMPNPWLSTDVGTPLTAGTANYAASSQTFYIDGAGSDIWGTSDQFHYVSQTLNGDGTIIARLRYQTVTSDWAKAGIMIKQSTTAGSPYVAVMTTPNTSPVTPNINGTGCNPNGCLSPLPPVTPTVGHGIHMQYNFNAEKSVTSATALAGYSSPNEWLKLQRSGNVFTSWYSTDGVTWNLVGTTTVTMGTTATIGMFVTSHNINQTSTVAFDHVQVTTTPNNPVPPPWLDTDVGAPTLAGSAGYLNGVFTVNGAGIDIWKTYDQFHYVYQPISGNGTLIARVISQTNSSSNAKAGIMFKQSTATGDSYFMIAAAPGGGVKVQYNFTGSVNGATYTFPNVWMKITRVGNVFTAYTSADGVTWTQVFTKTLAMNASITAGLFECSHNASVLGTATFDNVSFTPGP